MSTETNKTAALEFIGAMGRGDVEAAVALVTDDATWWIAGDLPISGERDREGIAKTIGGMAAASANPVVFEIRAVTAGEDRVAVEARSETDLANGKHYVNEYHIAFEFDGAKIKSIREYMDTLTVHQLMFA